MVNKILIIESLRPADLRTGELLYNNIIAKKIKDENLKIENKYFFAFSKQEFLEVINNFQNEIHETDEIILHLEAHGGNNEMQFGNYELLTWSELEKILIEINKKCKNKLHLNLATCHGMHVAGNFSIKQTAPYKTYISALNTLTPKEILEDNYVLYEEIIQSTNIYQAYTNFIKKQSGTKFRAKDTKHVLNQILGLQIMRFINSTNSVADLKIYIDNYLKIDINTNILESKNEIEEKIAYILDLFYLRFFPK
jgi:hypothetical protein